MKPRPPIYSDLDEDLSQRDLVERFVVGLAEHVDELQDAEAAGNFAQVQAGAADLATGAKTAGYPALVEAAERIAAAGVVRDPEAVRKSVVELTELAQRVRRGSRGAA